MVITSKWFFVLIIIFLSGCGSQRPALLNSSQTPTQQQVLVTATDTRATSPATMTPVNTISPSSSRAPTPTFDFSNYRLTWIRFSAPVYKVSFEYPSIYNEAPFQDECAPYDGYDGVVISSQSEIMVRSQDGLSLSDFIPVFIAKHLSTQPVEIILEIPSQAGPYPAQQVDYQLTDTDIKGTFTFVSYEETAYIFSFRSEGSCDITQLNLREWDAYQRAIETFRILH